MADAASSALGSPQIPSAPSAPSADTADLEQNSKNVFTELFGQENTPANKNLMNTVAAQQEKKRPFFGSKPDVKTAAPSLKDLKEHHPSHPGSALLKASLFFLVLVIAIGLSQNSSRFSFFGTNPALQKEHSLDQVAELKAEVTMQGHLAAVLLFSSFNSKADEYFYTLDQANSEYTSENKKSEYQDRLEKLKPELSSLLEEIQGHLSVPLSPEDMVAAQAIVDELTTQLHAKKGEVDDDTLLQDIQDLQTTRLLLQESTFKSFIAGLDLADLSKADLEKIYTDFSTIDASVIATLAKIKSQRLVWSTHWEGIEKLTKNVDPLFNTEFTGSLSVESIRFNADGTITVKGKTSTQDTKNFSLVSDLIDAYEASSSFTKVEDRSYTKNDDEEIYTGNFRINLTLE